MFLILLIKLIRPHLPKSCFSVYPVDHVSLVLLIHAIGQWSCLGKVITGSVVVEDEDKGNDGCQPAKQQHGNAAQSTRRARCLHVHSHMLCWSGANQLCSVVHWYVDEKIDFLRYRCTVFMFSEIHEMTVAMFEIGLDRGFLDMTLSD